MIESVNWNPNRKVKVNLYSECKYTASHEVYENRHVIEYSGLVKFEIVSGFQAREIELHSDLIDDHHEYLVLYFEDGDTATFRNSYVDMFGG